MVVEKIRDSGGGHGEGQQLMCSFKQISLYFKSNYGLQYDVKMRVGVGVKTSGETKKMCDIWKDRLSMKRIFYER